MGERQITLDCDVLQADGGTRTASITGAWVALQRLSQMDAQRSIIKDNPLRDHVAAISCGVASGEAVLDLDYAEDSTAETDANFVMTGAGGLVEVQGPAEGAPFTEAELMPCWRWRAAASAGWSPSKRRRSRSLEFPLPLRGGSPKATDEGLAPSILQLGSKRSA